METTIVTTISASKAFFFFISPIPIHARNNFASVDSSPEHRVPRTAFGVFHARQRIDALAVGSQGDGAKVLFIQICSQADRIPIYNGAVSSTAGCWAAACAARATSFLAAIFAELVQLTLKFILKLSRTSNIRTRREFNTALLQRIHGSGAHFFIHPNIGTKTATCALKLLFTFTF